MAVMTILAKPMFLTPHSMQLSSPQEQLQLIMSKTVFLAKLSNHLEQVQLIMVVTVWLTIHIMQLSNHLEHPTQFLNTDPQVSLQRLNRF